MSSQLEWDRFRLAEQQGWSLAEVDALDATEMREWQAYWAAQRDMEEKARR